MKFLLTHLLRGATSLKHGYPKMVKNFYSRTSCEVQRSIQINIAVIMSISTHAPLARCNLFVVLTQVLFGNFYSRTSCEVQRNKAGTFKNFCNFYSRTSCEVQPFLHDLYVSWYKFLLTHLLRGATTFNGFKRDFAVFLLTHLLRGATQARNQKRSFLLHFYSRTSCEVQHTNNRLFL